MDIKRKAARGIAVIAVALAAGHLVQSIGNKPATKPASKPLASAELTVKPSNLQSVAAGPKVAKMAIKPALETAPPLGKITLLPPPAELSNPALLALPAKAETQPQSCNASLDLMAAENAMINLTLIAPCHPNQRVVLRQGGLAVTASTTATGAVFATLPAMKTVSRVEVFFADGSELHDEITVPEMAGLRRFAVQWQGDDAFQINAFENGADYGDPGHVSAMTPHRPAAGLQAKGGYLTHLGDSATANALLAEVYTFPADPAVTSEVLVEAAITDKTCGRELLADTLTSNGGDVLVTELSLAMPECDAVGDYMVLNNLVLDRNMAAVN